VKGAKQMGNCVSVIINTVLLGAVYIVGVGVTSIVSKLVGKRFLDMKLRTAVGNAAGKTVGKASGKTTGKAVGKRIGKDTYWEDLDIKGRPLKEHYKQF